MRNTIRGLSAQQKSTTRSEAGTAQTTPTRHLTLSIPRWDYEQSTNEIACFI